MLFFQENISILFIIPLGKYFYLVIIPQSPGSDHMFTVTFE